MEDLGSRIREERKTKGLSQQELAGEAGISQSHLSAIERGGVEPSATVVQRIARPLGLSIGELLGETDRAPSPAFLTLRGQRSEGPADLPASLVDYVNLRRATGAPLGEEEVRALAAISRTWGLPRSADDWHFLMESIKRAVG